MRAWQKRLNARVWAQMEVAFLTLEGVGQWVLYKHALKKRAAGTTLAADADQGGQPYGRVGLFLLIDRFAPGWRAEYFSTSPPPSPLAVLESAITPAKDR